MKRLLAIALLASASSMSWAGVASCPLVPASGDNRHLELTTDPGTSVCIYSSNGNLNGNPNGGNADPLVSAGGGFNYNFIDATDTAGGLHNGYLTSPPRQNSCRPNRIG